MSLIEALPGLSRISPLLNTCNQTRSCLSGYIAITIFPLNHRVAIGKVYYGFSDISRVQKNAALLLGIPL